MFTDFAEFVKLIFQPMLQFLSFLPPAFRTLLFSAIGFLVFMACKRSVRQ